MASNNARSTRTHKTARAAFRAECREHDVPCWLCLQPIDYTAPAGHPDAFELDHYYTVSTHPELVDDPGNFRAGHGSCNRARGDKDPADVLVIGQQTREW